MDHAMVKCRGAEPRLHDRDSARVQVTREICEGSPHIILRAEVTNRAEETAHDVESSIQAKGAHIAQDEPNTGQTASRQPEQLPPPTHPDDHVSPPQELEMSTGPTRDI